MNNLSDTLKMPEFTIDSYVDKNGHEIPGMKRMYDIALALKDSIMQWGLFGLGKSQAVQQWNASKVAEYEARINKGEQVKPWDPKVCDVRLSMKEPVDLVGIPVPSKNEKGEVTTVWAIPSMWPRDNGQYSGGVIHLDEMNHGQPAILNAAFQLIQDRALGEYKVPDNYLIIGSANPEAFNSSVSELSMPLSNRFSHFNIKADFDSWLNYRLNNGGNVDVMSFLKTQAIDKFIDLEAIESKVGSIQSTLFTDVIVTPRSWEVIEKLLDLPVGTKETGGFTIEEKQRYATGRLGLALAAKLFVYLKDKEKFQNYREILEEGKPFKDESTSCFWAVQMACISAIVNCSDDSTCRQYILNFIAATEKLKADSLKVVNIIKLINLPKLQGRPDLFRVSVDARSLISLISNALK